MQLVEIENLLYQVVRFRFFFGTAFRTSEADAAARLTINELTGIMLLKAQDALSGMKWRVLANVAVSKSFGSPPIQNRRQYEVIVVAIDVLGWDDARRRIVCFLRLLLLLSQFLEIVKPFEDHAGLQSLKVIDVECVATD